MWNSECYNPPWQLLSMPKRCCAVFGIRCTKFASPAARGAVRLPFPAIYLTPFPPPRSLENMDSSSVESVSDTDFDSSVGALKHGFDTRREHEHYAKTHCSFCSRDGGNTPLYSCSHCK